MAIDYREYVLDTNSFKEPKTVSGQEAIATMLTRIILLEPGTNPLHPTMGVGIISNYRFLNTSDLRSSLELNIRHQIEQFLPEYQTTKVETVIDADNTVDIRITIDDTVYVYDSSQFVPITLTTIANN